MDFIGKKYKLSASENFDEFMKALGVGLIARKAGNAVSPTVELRKDGEGYNLLTTSTFKNTELKFVPGKELDEERADGTKVKTVMEFEGSNVLKQTQTAPDGTISTIVREFGTDELKAVMKVKDIVCTRTYKAL